MYRSYLEMVLKFYLYPAQHVQVLLSGNGTGILSAPAKHVQVLLSRNGTEAVSVTCTACTGLIVKKWDRSFPRLLHGVYRFYYQEMGRKFSVSSAQRVPVFSRKRTEVISDSCTSCTGLIVKKWDGSSLCILHIVYRSYYQEIGLNFFPLPAHRILVLLSRNGTEVLSVSSTSCTGLIIKKWD